MDWSTYLARGVSVPIQNNEANADRSLPVSIVAGSGGTRDQLEDDSSAAEDREHAIIEQINSLFRDTLSLTPFSRTIAIGFVRVCS